MLKLKDFSSKENPYRPLLEVNNDVHSQLYSVVETFGDNNLFHKIKGYDRTVAEVISHTLTTHQSYFIGHLSLGKAVDDYSEPKITSVKDALGMIQKNLEETNDLICNMSQKDFTARIKTEWGQELTKEMAVWMGITQIMLHLGEVCVMAGNGGFYKGTLG